MKKFIIKHAETGETLIHYDGAFADYTLCGDAMEKDTCAGETEPIETTQRVNCKMCLAVVKHVRGK